MSLVSFYTHAQFRIRKPGEPDYVQKAGEVLAIEEERALDWEQRNFGRILRVDSEEIQDWPWGVHKGRYLSALPSRPGFWKRVVACLNIWDDCVDLQATYETWYPHVDHVIAVDGAYHGTPVSAPQSTDGTLEFLRSLSKVEVIEAGFMDQPEKRSLYFAAAEEGDLLFIVDADEVIHHGERLRQIPELDVGWVRYLNPIYKRAQDFPRLFRWRPGLHYRDRHHYIFEGNQLVTTCQEGGAGYHHEPVPIQIQNYRGFCRHPVRIHHAHVGRQEQARREKIADPIRQTGGLEPLRIVNITSLDPGMVVHRLHSAINATSPHESIMLSSRHDRAYREPYQYSLVNDREICREICREADLLHVHMHFYPLLTLGVRWEGPTVIHHHGTMYRNTPDRRAQEDAERAQVRLCSNLELLRYPASKGMYYLPNPVPFAQYRELGLQHRPSWEERPFRIAHSPTKRHLKGTDEFLDAIQELQTRGVDVEAVIIEGQTFQESLRLKATCHAIFDSFWLGIQCSGLEAAAMGLPVIAGDDHVAVRYRSWLREVPFTFAGVYGELLERVLDLATDEGYYDQEAKRVSTYVRTHHDYGPVVRKYLEILDERLQWREKMSIGKFSGLKEG